MFTLRQWQFLTSRNRCPVPGAFPCMAAATNPGNIGHAWVKSLWIDKQPAPGMENPAEYDPADYDFIPARVSDNPIYAGDENYLKSLRALPSHLRRAFLDGDWDVFAGQYFDRFDYTRHVVRAEEIRLEAVVAALDLGGLGLRASVSRVLARSSSRWDDRARWFCRGTACRARCRCLPRCCPSTSIVRERRFRRGTIYRARCGAGPIIPRA